jgi:hypothetical protein
MAERKRDRFDKAALHRIKVTTVAVSVMAFAGSMGVIAYAHPGTSAASTTVTTDQAQTVSSPNQSSSSQVSSAALQLPTLSQRASVFPRTRTRGS